MRSTVTPIDRIVEAEKYLRNAREYYDNSQTLLTQKELPKAGEMLWGAIAEVVKGLKMMLSGAMEKVNESLDVMSSS